MVFSRRNAVVLLVVLLHGGVLWALQTGLLHRAAEVVVPVQVLAQLMESPPAPAVAPPPASQPLPQAPPAAPARPRPVPAPPAPVPATSLPPVPADAEPDRAPLVAPVPPSAANPVPASAVVVAPPATSAPTLAPATPAAPQVVLPSSDARYLYRPLPVYPRLSERRMEHGTVVLKVWVRADGSVDQVEVETSSGFPRLDRAALDVVPRWTFVPGTVNGVPQRLPVLVPVRFDAPQ